MTRTRTMAGVSIAALACLACAASGAEFRPGALTGSIVVDGRLDEPVWQNAPVGSSFGFLKARAADKPAAATSFRVLAGADAVWFGIRCEEPKMAEIKNPATEGVEIFVAPDGKPFTYYQFGLNASGADPWTYCYIEGGNTTKGAYAPLWESAAYRGKDFWTVEAKIPLSAFYYTDAADFSNTWLVNVARDRRAGPWELTTWSPLERSFNKEPANFRAVAGMPRKDARFDVRIAGMSAAVNAASGTGFSGSVDVRTSASAATAGEYLFSLYDGEGRALLAGRKVRIPASDGSFTADGVTFPAEGKMPVKGVLRSVGGEEVAGCRAALQIGYRPLVFDVVEPFYARCIFPGQTVSKIAGSVACNQPPEVLRTAEMVLSLSGPGVEKSLTKPAARTVPFSFDTPSLAVGEYALVGRLVAGGRTLAEERTAVRKLEKPAGSCVYVDRDLNLVVDGTPIFLRCWFGSTWMVSTRLLRTVTHPNTRHVNAWNCGVGMEAERLDPADIPRTKKDVEPSAKVFEEMKKRIEANRTNKELLWYYLADEPECRGLSPVYLKHQYEYIKRMDPYRPVMIITRSPELFTGCADILDPHPYINPYVDASGARRLTSPMRRTRDQMRMVLTAGKGRIPAWLNPQVFSYAFVDSYADHPTFDEYNCAVFTAVANGAKGITAYTYGSQFASVEMRLGCNFVFETLAGLNEFLVSPGPPLPAKVTAPDDGADVWIKKVGGTTLVIAVNLLDRPLRASVECAGLKGVAKLHGYRDRTTASPRGGRLTLALAPYQVAILTSRRMGTNLKTVAALKKEIAAAKAKLAKPGNLLYGRGRDLALEASDTYMSMRGAAGGLTDGIEDALAWKDVLARESPAWLEISFKTSPSAFRTAKVYASNVKVLELFVGKAGEWTKVAEAKESGDWPVVLTLPERVSAEKIKLVMTAPSRAERSELCELELYE